VAQVRGMSQCAKNEHRTRTRTRDTRDPITAGIPVPVPNPIGCRLITFAKFTRTDVRPVETGLSDTFKLLNI
jgi:hypothetical protein